MISLVRDIVYRAVAAGPPTHDDDVVPVHRWLPLSIEEVPCFVVGRPTLLEGDEKAIAATTTPVFVFGRTTRDDDAQIELDELADLLIARLWQPWTAESVSLQLTAMQPSTVVVGQIEFPIYTATVAAECMPC